MKSRSMQLTRLAAAVSLAVLQLGAAYAQEAIPAAEAIDPAIMSDVSVDKADKGNAVNLDQVIVTGTPVGTTKMKASVSISTMDAEQIQMAAPTSAAEVLRSIPGVRSESSGGEGNANVTVRGVPISAGGARYVQFQEDGLPILQNGDLNFATPDSFMRVDGGLDHIEVVRGGASSVLGTNAPGGIINFITKTGEEKGGSIGISKGIGFDQMRYDFDYGGPITDKTRFFVGGFYRSGDGARPAGVTMEDGGQIRANITHEFDNGFIRLNFKHLDDKTPTDLPVPVMLSGTPGSKNRTISEIPGIDPRTASFYSPYWIKDIVLDRNGNRVATNVNDGLHVVSNAFGFESAFKVGDGWTVSENFRKTSNSGRFIGVFPADNVAPAAAGTTYATGPNKGQAYTGLVFNPVVFNTSLDDLGNTANELKVSKVFQLTEAAKLTTVVGLSTNQQNVATTWNFNSYLMQATGSQPALLANGANTTGFEGVAFGGCCERTYDLKYKMNSPYFNTGLELGALNVDGGMRFDRQTVSGIVNTAPTGVYPLSPAQIVNYRKSNTSYSIGANYRITSNLAAFARISDGVSFNADRILLGSIPVDGSTPIPLNEVKQNEVGLKWKQGNFSTFMTVFQAKTDESNYELTSQKFTSNRYDGKGVELETAYRIGGFRINSGVTYTHARIVGAAAADAATIGNAPRRQANVVYQVAPSYSFGDAIVGASVIGTTKSFADNANTKILPAFAVVNLFTSYAFDARASIAFTVNNLFNKIGYTEMEDDRNAARSINGRTAKVSLKYAF
ncbi:TonB-dependent receptor [Glaciimonas sp. GG7]